MPSLFEISKYAEAALASYGTELQFGSGNSQPYRLAGMAIVQGDKFDSTWRVLDQIDLSDGFSAVVFQPVDEDGRLEGPKVLAIRGTEASHWGIDYLVDAINVAILGTARGSRQYDSLENFYSSLIAQGKIGAAESLVVTGHSLGGFLAQAFAQNHETVSSALTFNAPGFSVAQGQVTNIRTELLKLFGLSGTIDNSRIFNIRALDGISATSGLGQMIGSVQAVNIEPGTPLHNHSVATLTDSLAVQTLFWKLDQAATPDVLNSIVRAASAMPTKRLETALDALRSIFLGKASVLLHPTVIEDRESLYSNIYALQDATGFSARIDLLTLDNLAAQSSSSIAEMASQDVAHRYALSELNSFSLSGDDTLYAAPNSGHEIDLYDPATGAGMTQQFIADRSEMLGWKNVSFSSLGSGRLLGNRPESLRYSDIGSNLTLSVGGRAFLSVGMPAIVTFGSSLSDTLTGGDIAIGDHLYGAGGNDTLQGNGGNDYLEGGAGNDTLTGGGGDDVILGGAGFDTYVYDEGDGQDEIADAGGAGEIRYNGRVLSGGAIVAEGVYRDAFGTEYSLVADGEDGHWLLVDGNIFVEDFHDGDLGIALSGELEPPSTPENDLSHFYFDSILPDGFDPDADFAFLHDVAGSSGDDYFYLTSEVEVAGRAGNDVAVFDSAAAYSTTLDLGADDDYIDAGPSAGADNGAMLVGGGGADYIVGSQGDDSLWGDSYRAYSLELLRGPAPVNHGAYAIDGFVYNLDATDGIGLGSTLPSGTGAYLSVHGEVERSGAGFGDDVLEFLLSDGSFISGSLGEVFAAVLGSGTFDDYIDAGEGDDVVVGGSGSDEIHGGAGDDRLLGDYETPAETRFSGAPSYLALQEHFGDAAALFGRFGDDRIDGGEGDDTISDTDGGDDVLVGGEGDDFIESREDFWLASDGRGAHNLIDGGAGNDEIDLGNGTGGFDIVEGGDGDDLLIVFAGRSSADGPAGRAFVFGGAGNDVLEVDADDGFIDGGDGDDEYTVFGQSNVISDSGGNDLLHLVLPNLVDADAWLETFAADDSAAPGRSELASLESWTVAQEAGDLVFSLRVDVEGETPYFAELRIEDWFDGAGHRIEQVTTGDEAGTVLTGVQFESWGGLHYGSEVDDELLEASPFSDRAIGGGGADLIATGDGADLLYGGRGDDDLVGGYGDDAYYYAPGDGNDTIEDIGGFDEIRFGPGIAASGVTATLGDSGLTVGIAGSSIQVLGGRRDEPGIDRLRFADGTTVRLSTLLPPEPVPPLTEPDGVDEQGDGEEAETGQAAPTGPAESVDELPARASGMTVSPLQAPDPQPFDVPENAVELVGVPFSPMTLPVIAQNSPTSESLDVEHDSPSGPQPEDTRSLEIASLIASLTRTSNPPIFRVDVPSDSLNPSLPIGEDPDQERAPQNQPLDLQAFVEAIQAFEAGPSGTNNASSPAQANRPLAPDEEQASLRGPELSSWALTNALLQFHLDQQEGAGDAADLSSGRTPDATLLRTSMSGQPSFGLSPFAQPGTSLTTFSGLQEGFTTL